ncbi:unnamed protein product [Cylicostephanus goldi]|uniref:U1-type domain-containing protein n=1 Tax=Cylicostephanus goldi TaxID=71465 RepID=A0A3P6TWH7_CYLGO|nr:unnamed protein product [Cylicostephanus goldi]
MNGYDFKEKEEGIYESSDEANMTQRCEICNKVIAGKRNWCVFLKYLLQRDLYQLRSKHIAGKKHKNVLRLLKRQQKAAIAIACAEESSTNGLLTDCLEDTGIKRSWEK